MGRLGGVYGVMELVEGRRDMCGLGQQIKGSLIHVRRCVYS
jgi:hypothetical protein